MGSGEGNGRGRGRGGREREREEGGICCMIHTPACPCQTGEETAVKEE